MKPVRIGCSGWNYSEWRGLVYPEGRRPVGAGSSTTRRCSTRSRSTPPSTGCRSRETVEHWVAATPDDFVFAIKASRYLTHIKRLRDLEGRVERLLEPLEPLLATPKMGPLLWQLPANFHRDDERLAEALAVLPEAAQLHRVSPSELVRARRCWSCCARTASPW